MHTVSMRSPPHAAHWTQWVLLSTCVQPTPAAHVKPQSCNHIVPRLNIATLLANHGCQCCPHMPTWRQRSPTSTITVQHSTNTLYTQIHTSTRKPAQLLLGFLLPQHQPNIQHCHKQVLPACAKQSTNKHQAEDAIEESNLCQSVRSVLTAVAACSSAASSGSFIHLQADTKRHKMQISLTGMAAFRPTTSSCTTIHIRTLHARSEPQTPKLTLCD